MKVLILSDIHGNQAALQAVLDKAAETLDIKGCMLLGDLIDYGMHSNEVIEIARQMPYLVMCSLRGNHEDAVIRNEYTCFSSQRGSDSARYTASILNQASWNYICCEMEACGRKEFKINGKKCLAVHGSLEEPYWKGIDLTKTLKEYRDYDYVFSGHTHLPHFIEKYYACEDMQRRNKKKTVFINPGSVGQPRNLNNMAQYVILDMETEQIAFEKVKYDIDGEQADYNGQIDEFYRERLRWGI